MRAFKRILPTAGLVLVTGSAGCFEDPLGLDTDTGSQTDSGPADSTGPGTTGPGTTSSATSGTTGPGTTSSETSGTTGPGATEPSGETLETSASGTTSDASSAGSSSESGSTEGDTGSSGDEEGSTSTGECVGAGCPCQGDGECEDGLTCTAEVCSAPACGDGNQDVEVEQCDDGNLDDGDGCQSDCTPTEFTVHAGFWSTCLLIEGGRLRCWGRNAFGQLGYGHTDDLGLAVHPWQIPEVELPSPAAEISIGERFSCARIGTGDDVICWGAGFDGMLGTGSEDDQLDPAMLPPINLGAAGAMTLGTGERHSCAIDNNGDTRCWGRASEGALGYGNENDIGDNEAPVSAGVVSGGASAIGIGVGSEHTCVVLNGGTIRCWGESFRGQVGVGQFQDVGDDELPSAFAAIDFGTPATKVVAGSDHTCALFSDGSVQCWGAAQLGRLGDGNNSSGAIGDNELVTGRPPVALGGVAIDIGAGSAHTCALLEGGSMVCWGANGSGALGTGDTEPVGDDETPASAGPIDLPSPVVQMAVGGEHTCAVLDDSRVFCWGRNNAGQLGHAVSAGSILAPLMALPVQIFEPSG